jgi:hypothetical protein
MESLRTIKGGIIGDGTVRVFLLVTADHLGYLLGRFILYHTFGIVNLVCGSGIHSSDKKSYVVWLMDNTSSSLVLIQNLRLEKEFAFRDELSPVFYGLVKLVLDLFFMHLR